MPMSFLMTFAPPFLSEMPNKNFASTLGSGYSQAASAGPAFSVFLFFGFTGSSMFQSSSHILWYSPFRKEKTTSAFATHPSPARRGAFYFLHPGPQFHKRMHFSSRAREVQYRV